MVYLEVFREDEFFCGYFIFLYFSFLLGNLPRFGRRRVVLADRRGGYDEILFFAGGKLFARVRAFGASLASGSQY